MNSIDGIVNWGIIGCGDVCEVKSGPAFNKVPNSRLVAVMRRDAVKAQDYARRHGVEKAYSNASELIRDQEVNAIYIATPPAFHESYTEEALRAGKPVYVEKPVTLNASSCERMISLEREYKGAVSVAHYRRGLPLFHRIKSQIKNNAIGQVRLIHMRVLQPPKSKIVTQTADNWRVNPEISGGGLFHDLSPHQLDIVYWIFGEPSKVSGRSINQSQRYNAADLTVLEAEFEQDVYLNSIWAFNVAESAEDEYCEIIGEKGKMRFAFFRKSTLDITTGNGTEFLEFDFPEHIQQPMSDNVVKFFRGEGPNPCSLEEALITIRMMDATRNRTPDRLPNQ